MKRLFKLKYPKILALLITIILAYFIFSNQIIKDFMANLSAYNLSYLGIFIAGLLFSFGFTAPFSAGFFITLNPSNIWLAGIIGGLGAMCSDLLIFKLIRFSFKDELKKLKKEKISKEIENLVNKTLGNKIRIYIMYAIAGITIASPLPDEAGVIMLAGLTRIKPKILALISFILNTAGILVLLYL
jgi:uncharacterized membrane protein YdjX (TVP38/TMEM64 family)